MEESGPGELPQLMRSLQQHLGTPVPTPVPIPKAGTPMKTEGGAEGGTEVKTEAASPAPSGSNEGSGIVTPIPFKFVMEEGKETFHYQCPQCDHIRATRRGMDSHIRSPHSLTPFLCSFCEFSSYNLDSLNRNEKTHNKN